MEGISATIGLLWEQLKTVTLPIINLSCVDFLLGVFVIKIVIDVLRYFLGLQLGSTSEYDTGISSKHIMNSAKRNHISNTNRTFYRGS